MRFAITFLPWLILILLLSVVAVSWSTGGIVAEILRSDVSPAERVVQLQEFFRNAGVWAPVAYVVFVTVEVIVAPIPGLMLYAPGGLVFGPWLGGVLAIIGNVLGAGVSCSLTRSAGNQWLNRISTGSSVEELQVALEKRGLWLIVLLRLNPLTSTDLLSYAAGFTRIPVSRVMLATGLGMTPLCLIQSWLSDSIFTRWPQLLWPLLIAGLIYLIIVGIIITRLLKRPAIVCAPESSTG